MEDCIFCKIARKEIPADIIYEDKDFIAFSDLNPQAKTHILLIPKLHTESLKELAENGNVDLAGRLVITADKIAKQLEIDQTGYRVVTNVGKDAGQTVSHLHLHVLGGQKLGPIV